MLRDRLISTRFYICKRGESGYQWFLSVCGSQHLSPEERTRVHICATFAYYTRGSLSP